MATSLVGTWRLLSFQVEMADTGERVDLYGPDPHGRAVLTDDGYMMALVTAADRPVPTDQAGMAGAFRSLLAYSGPYRVEGDKLITDCDLAWQPAWVGTEQVRPFAFDGERLTMRTAVQAHPAYPGRQVVIWLDWRRESLGRD